MGIPQAAEWFITENPLNKWMITRGTPILGTLIYNHIYTAMDMKNLGPRGSRKGHQQIVEVRIDYRTFAQK